MHTYSHFVIGTVAGKMLFPNSVAAQIVLVTASVLPDLVMVPQFLMDKVRHKQPLAEQSKGLLFAKSASHSIPLWFTIALLPALLPFLSTTPTQEQLWFQGVVLAFLIGWLLHLIIDCFTHNGKEYSDTETGCFWPSPIRPQILGMWEYRYGPGILQPKPLEAAIDAGLVLFYCLT